MNTKFEIEVMCPTTCTINSIDAIKSIIKSNGWDDDTNSWFEIKDIDGAKTLVRVVDESRHGSPCYVDHIKTTDKNIVKAFECLKFLENYFSNINN